MYLQRKTRNTPGSAHTHEHAFVSRAVSRFTHLATGLLLDLLVPRKNDHRSDHLCLVGVTGTEWKQIKAELVAMASIVEAFEHETVQQYKRV